MSEQSAKTGTVRPWRHGLAALVLAAAAGWAGPASAISGDVLDLDGSYVIPGPSCDVLRDITDTELNIIIPCSAEARADGVRVCDIVSASDINVGLAVGQCQDRFPIPLSPPEPGDEFETNTQVQATTFGADTAYTPGGAGTTDIDVVCNTFAGGVNKCIQVRPGSCGPGTCPANADIKAVADSCVEVRNQLQNAVTTTPPDLSHYLAIDVDSAGQPDYVVVGVCPGFLWDEFDPAAVAPPGAAGPLQTKYYDELLFATILTPVCITMNRKTYCR
jgi:hypothetical protein